MPHGAQSRQRRAESGSEGITGHSTNQPLRFDDKGREPKIEAIATEVSRETKYLGDMIMNRSLHYH